MAQYTWKGWDNRTAEQREGTVDAESPTEARLMLSNSDILIAELTPRRKKLSEIEFEIGGKKIKQKDIAWLARSLSSSQSAGLPTQTAISIFSRQRAGTPLGRVLTEIEADLAEGSSISEAFREREDVFGSVMCSLLEVGEEGDMITALTQIADYFETSVRLRRSIRSAISYPVTVVAISTVIFIGLLIYAVPLFSELYGESNAALPLPTQMVIGMSDLLLGKWYIWIGALIGIYFFIRKVKNDPKLKVKRDKFILRIPIFGELLRKVAVARYTSALAAVLSSGSGILPALELAGRSANNQLLNAANERVMEAVSMGDPLSEAFRAEEVFGVMTADVCYVGETTGDLTNMLTRYAKITEEEVESAVDQMMSLIEPLSVVVIGSIIGFVVISMYLPLFNLAEIIDS